MGFLDGDLAAIWLSLKLASIVTILLLFVGTPIAWWLSQTRSRIKPLVSALVALPLILPPTVIGFYLLISMGPQGPLGQMSGALGFGGLAFTFWGLVIGSMIYSLPFVVQPLQNAFEAIGKRPLEIAYTLRATPWDRFRSVVVPLAKPGFITASVLGFAHTVGEFGVVLMIGGNIPNETRVVSIQIYNHVEALNYTGAYWLSAIMLLFSFFTLLVIYRYQQHQSSIGMRF